MQSPLHPPSLLGCLGWLGCLDLVPAEALLDGGQIPKTIVNFSVGGECGGLLQIIMLLVAGLAAV